MRTPDSPWMGSGRTATTSSVIACGWHQDHRTELTRTRGVRSVMIMSQWIIGKADDCRGTPVEVAGSNDDHGLTIWHTLDLVALAGDLDRGLHGLGAGDFIGSIMSLPISRSALHQTVPADRGGMRAMST